VNILFPGAAGKTGRDVLAQSLAAGHTVTAFVRDPQKLDRTDIAVAVGDARRVEDLGAALDLEMFEARTAALDLGRSRCSALVFGIRRGMWDVLLPPDQKLKN
jgi:putative NADH-flavin reductase